MTPIKIYTPHISNRLKYSCNIVFNLILKANYELTSDNSSSGIRINYSSEKINNTLQVIPSGLLEQTGISSHNTNPGNIEDLPVIFYNGEGEIAFDIFSAVFYMCSRYEEYLPFEADEHGRFQAEDSVAFRNGFHDKPIVEIWSKFLGEKLEVEYPSNTFNSLVTIDVDDAWMFKHRGFFRSIAHLKLDFFSFKFKQFKERFKIFLGTAKDPWDTFDYIGETEKNLSQPVRYFFLLNKGRSFDGSLSPKTKALRTLIAGLQKKNKVGIHPSYASNDSVTQTRKEYFELSYIVKNKPQHSRQHYLKFSLPFTFRKLIKLGILEEYSMGWVNQIGFRAGISRPFPFYDLSEEQETHLMLTPFMYMDRTLKDYLSLSPEEAKEQLKTLAESVKDVGGQFTSLWHNSSLSEYGEWQGWRTVFEKNCTYANK
jgi:hypothetical protein